MNNNKKSLLLVSLGVALLIVGLRAQGMLKGGPGYAIAATPGTDYDIPPVMNTVTRTLVTVDTGQGGVVLDAVHNVIVSYSVVTAATATIGGSASCTVFLEIADTNSATPGAWTTVSKVANQQAITLAVALQSVQTITFNLGALIPAGKYMRIRYALTGTSSCTYDRGQETTFQ